MPKLKREVAAEEVFKLAAMFCTIKEMTSFFECSDKYLYDNFMNEIERGRAAGKMSVRRFQYKAAEDGNVTMLIWLGRQYLEQVDRTEISLGNVPDKVFIEEAKRRLGDFKQRLVDAV